MIGGQRSLEDRLESIPGRIALISLVSARDHVTSTDSAAEDAGTLTTDTQSAGRTRDAQLTVFRRATVVAEPNSAVLFS